MWNSVILRKQCESPNRDSMGAYHRRKGKERGGGGGASGQCLPILVVAMARLKTVKRHNYSLLFAVIFLEGERLTFFSTLIKFYDRRDVNGLNVLGYVISLMICSCSFDQHVGENIDLKFNLVR